MNVYETLVEYGKSDIYPMHMPGHKRNPEFSMCNPYAIDVTEAEGLDNLHHPEGMIRDLMNRMKEIYRTEETYILVNGSTCGILAAISACCHRGDTIIMDRNCHRSVYHAVYLLNLKPVYLYREQDERTGIATKIHAEQVREALEENRASCVVVTSPTYEGIVSEMEKLAGVAHRKGVPLIVDEAHGAHFAWDESMPQTAMEAGADIVVESLHKTLPCFTQTGVLHLCSHRVERERIERYLDIYETSSPSYILMAGVSQCMEWMSENGREAFVKYRKNLAAFEERAAGWKHLELWKHPAKEPSKLVILTGTEDFTGHELADILRKQYAIEIEMEAPGYILAMTSICDSEEGFRRLADALEEIDIGQGKGRKSGAHAEGLANRLCVYGRLDKPLVRMGIYAAMNHPYREIETERGVGEIAAEYAFLYPPGIPFLVPGEEITESAVEKIRLAGEKGLKLFGPADETGKKLRIVDRK